MKSVVNVNKLKGKIVEKGFKVETLAESIGIGTSTFYMKLRNCGETFSIKEVNLICQHLNLNKEEAMEIFFANCVAYNATKRAESMMFAR